MFIQFQAYYTKVLISLHNFYQTVLWRELIILIDTYSGNSLNGHSKNQIHSQQWIGTDWVYYLSTLK